MVNNGGTSNMSMGMNNGMGMGMSPMDPYFQRLQAMQNSMNQGNNQGMQNTNTNSPINWVNGMAEVNSWPVSTGQAAVLMDSNKDTFYIKTSDNIGKCTIRTFDYQETTPEPEAEVGKVDVSNLATKKEVAELKEMIAQMQSAAVVKPTQVTPAANVTTPVTSKPVTNNGK